MTNFLLPLILALFLNIGCSSKCATGYYTLYDIEEKETTVTEFKSSAEQNQTKTYKPWKVGDYGNDWLFTLKSIDGMIRSVLEDDLDFLYLWTDSAKIIKLSMVLNGVELVSDTFYAPDTGKRLVTIVLDASEYSWTLTDFNQAQGVISHLDITQSYKYFRQPFTITPLYVVSVEIRAIISQDMGQIRVVKTEKFLEYSY